MGRSTSWSVGSTRESPPETLTEKAAKCVTLVLPLALVFSSVIVEIIECCNSLSTNLIEKIKQK